MRTKTIEIGTDFGAEYKGKYVFTEISWARRSRIIQKNTRYHSITGNVLSSDYVAIQAATIMAALKEQPENKPISLEKLLSEEDGIPVGLGELFSKIVNRLCGVTVEETRFLSEPCEEENRIQASPSSVSAKNSPGRLKSSIGNQQKQSRNSS